MVFETGPVGLENCCRKSHSDVDLAGRRMARGKIAGRNFAGQDFAVGDYLCSGLSEEEVKKKLKLIEPANWCSSLSEEEGEGKLKLMELANSWNMVHTDVRTTFPYCSPSSPG